MSRQSFSVTVAPATEPITVAELKSQARVDISDDDDLLGRLISAARAWVETNTRRALVTQQVTIQTSCFPAIDALKLHVIAPLVSVTSVSYYDTDNVDQLLSSADYIVDSISEPGAVHLVDGESWPSTAVRPDAVRILCVVGYGAVPEDLKHAVHLMAAHFYEHREGVVIGTTPSSVPFTVDALIGPYLRPEFH